MVIRALCILFTSLISAQAIACSYSIESFSNWMQTYYRSPKPEVLLCSLKYYADSEIFAEYPDARMPTAYFFANALPQNEYPSLFSAVSENATLESKIFALHVFWVDGSSVAIDLISTAGKEWAEPEIQEMVPDLLAQDAWNPLLDGARSAADLDSLWAIYFATGDQKAIQEIAGVLHFLSDGGGSEIAIGGAASWSLTSNATHYPEVRLVVLNLYEQASGIQKERLKKIVEASAVLPHNQSAQPDQPAAGL